MRKKILKIVSICSAVSLLFLSSCGGGGNNGYYDTMKGGMYYVESNPDNYQYESVIEQGFVETAQTASSYFSLDKNTAGYSFMRSQIRQNLEIAPDSVRLEEYVNYFKYDYPTPATGEGVKSTAYISDCPWNSEHKLMTIGIKTEESALQSEGGNYVFLVDISGSMSSSSLYDEGNETLSRLDLVKHSLKTLVEGLGANDSVAIVTYASGVKVRLSATAVTSANRSKINKAIDDLTAYGSTFGSGGLEKAYKQAQTNFRQGGNNRVVLMSDGDFNVGIYDTDELKEFVQEKAKTGVYLSVLGFGMGNTNDGLMQTLALNGNGNYAYIDTKLEAKKVLQEELSGTLYTVAKDAKAGVTFNAETVSSYRLLGYDMKRMSESDFENTEKDAGEIGSNLCVTAMYELALNENAAENSPLAEVHIKWKTPQEQNKETKISVLNTDNGTNDTAFAACVAEFALVLRQSQYAANASLAEISNRLNGLQTYLQTDEYKAEFAEIVSYSIQSKKD